MTLKFVPDQVRGKSCRSTSQVRLKILNYRTLEYCLGDNPPKNNGLVYYTIMTQLRLFVRSWISTNSGLKFSLLFWFVYFCVSVYFKTSENRTSLDPNKICGKTLLGIKIALKILLTQD